MNTMYDSSYFRNDLQDKQAHLTLASNRLRSSTSTPVYSHCGTSTYRPSSCVISISRLKNVRVGPSIKGTGSLYLCVCLLFGSDLIVLKCWSYIRIPLALWRHSRGTLVALWRHSRGTVAALSRYSRGTLVFTAYNHPLNLTAILLCHKRRTPLPVKMFSLSAGM